MEKMKTGKFERLKTFARTKKGRWTLVSLTLLLLFSFAYAVGNENAKIELKEDKVDYETLQDKLDDLRSAIQAKEQELEDEDSKLQKKETEVNELLALLEDIDTLTEEKEETSADVDDAKEDLENINADLKTATKDLEKLEKTITKKKEDPTQLLSGVYIVGEDVEPGRYQATNVGSGSNFFVYSDSGSVKVNTILGDSSVGSGDYVFFANDGDLIETNAEVKLIPVE